MSLTRDEILATNDRPSERVHCPEWGGDVLIASMSGTARDAWEQSLLGVEGKVNMNNIRARLVAHTAVDDMGVPLFGLADIEALGAKSAAALDRCTRVAQRLNKLTDADLDDAKGN